MECLNNFIGLKYCNQETPESGIYINGLPGMSTELADNIANSEQVTFAQVWTDVKERAFLRLKDDVINYLSNGENNAAPVNFNQVVYQTKRLTKVSRNTEVVSGGEQWRGVYVKLPESRYVEFFLRDLYVYSSSVVADVPFKVWDVNDGTVLYESTTDLSVGLNVISVNQSFPLKYGVIELFIGLDCADFNSIKTWMENYYWYDCDYNCAYSNNGYRDQTIDLRPAVLDKTSDVTFANIDRQGTGKGVSIAAEIRCSVEDFICENRFTLKQSIWYLLALEMLEQKIGSPRLNYFTASNLEQTNYLKEDFNKKYNRSLKIALDTIPLTGMCVDCEEKFTVGYGGNLP